MNRIVVLTNYFHPTKGGVSRFATEVCKNLLLLERQVIVISESVGSIKEYTPYCTKFIGYKGFRKLPLVLAALLRNLGCLLAVVFNIKRTDTVLIITWRTFGTICWALKIPYVLVALGSELTYENALRGVPFAEWFKRKVISNAKMVLCISLYTEKTVKNISSDACTSIIGCGVNIDYWKSIKPTMPINFTLEDNSRYIISVGSLTKRKGFDYLIATFAKSHYAIDGYLVIVGSGEERNYLVDCIENCGVKSKVLLVSNITDNELAYLYLKADLFVMLNYNYKGDYEGFGIVFLEASYFGLPTIGGVDGGSQDAIVDSKTGYLFDPLNEEDKIVETLNFLHGDYKLRNQLGQTGIEYVNNKNTWAHVAARINVCTSDL